MKEHKELHDIIVKLLMEYGLKDAKRIVKDIIVQATEDYVDIMNNELGYDATISAQ